MDAKIDVNEVIDFWREFNFDSKRDSLDKTCVEIRDLKTSSINGRKKLNEITKTFRSTPKEEQLNGLTDLLKSYQDEIDQLSRRSKFCEAAFFSLYKSIYDAPDPVPALEGLIFNLSATSTHQLDIERLKNEIAQYEKEFQLLKNQDITIRRLEDQISDFKLKIEDKVMEEVSKRVAEVEEQAEFRIANINEVAKAAEKRLALAVESMKQAQASTERAQTQLYDVSSQAEQRLSALSIENQMLAEGCDRLSSRVAELEAENEALNVTLAKIDTGSQSSLSRHRSNLHSISQDGNEQEDIQTLKLVMSELRQELTRKEDSHRQDKLHFEHALRDMSQQLSREKETATRLKLELADRPQKEDYLSIRRQLKLLQRITFHLADEDTEDPEHTGPLEDKLQLETLLTARLRLLEAESGDLRRELKGAQQRESLLNDTVASLKKSLEQSTSLAARLEMDLETQTRINQAHSAVIGDMSREGGEESMEEFAFITASASGPIQVPPRSKMIGRNKHLISTVNSSVPLSVSSLGTNASAANTHNPILETNDQQRAGASGQLLVNPTGNAPGVSSMVTIIQGQRDRYKQKLMQAEVILMEVQKQVKSLNQTKTQLESDNLALYSKIRYLTINRSSGGNENYSDYSPHSYPPAGTGSAGYRRHFTETSSADFGGKNINDVESRYNEMYEQKLNPFAEFSRTEKQRRVQELSVPDRIVLNTIIAVVSNPTGRRFIVFYLGAMHLLVFAIVYYNAHYVHYGCETVLPPISHEQVTQLW